MSRFTDLPAAEKEVYVRETAARLNLAPQIVEKDFWVCWTLKVLFSRPEFAPHLVFKGGTSLSKVFKVIGRFSEDIDLSIGLPLLGRDESFLAADASASRTRRHLEQIEAQCAAFVQHDFRLTLENAIQGVLGARPGGGDWLEYQLEAATKSPVLRFRYPAIILPEASASYIEQTVKMELGSLTDQRPAGQHRVAPLIAEIVADGMFEDFSCAVVALEVERTFWEKATILHAEYHRPKVCRSEIGWRGTTRILRRCGIILPPYRPVRNLSCWRVWSPSNPGTTHRSGRSTNWRGRGLCGFALRRHGLWNWRTTIDGWQSCTFRNRWPFHRSSQRCGKRKAPSTLEVWSVATFVPHGFYITVSRYGRITFSTRQLRACASTRCQSGFGCER